MANDLDRGYEARTPPITLRDDRSIIRYFLYSTFTCGIYAPGLCRIFCSRS